MVGCTGAGFTMDERWPSSNIQLEDFRTELDFLAQLRHKHIIRLLGWCVSSKGKNLLTRRRKELERLIVYEYMENGTLFDHLHPNEAGSSVLSPVTMSWKKRIDVLLRVSQAIEYLHCHANPPVIHCDIKSSNILFDVSWVPHVSDFGLSVVRDMASELPCLDFTVRGTLGYIDLEYLHTGHVKPAINVYSLGVVMLEVLTGKKAFSQSKEMNGDLASFALPIIEAGNIEEMLDRRPVPGPTPWQLHTLKRVAQIARCCVKFAGKDRPTISGIVANLETAQELICRGEPDSLDKSGLWPFLEKVDDSPDSLHARNVPSACYCSDLEPDVLEDGP